MENYRELFESKLKFEEKKEIAYHGSPINFSKFSSKYFGVRSKHNKVDVGFHFSDDINYVEAYANIQEKINAYAYKLLTGDFPKTYKSFDPTIYKVSLDINNPYRVAYSKDINRESIKKAKDLGHDLIITTKNPWVEYVVFDSDLISILSKEVYTDSKVEELANKEYKKIKGNN